MPVDLANLSAVHSPSSLADILAIRTAWTETSQALSLAESVLVLGVWAVCSSHTSQKPLQLAVQHAPCQANNNRRAMAAFDGAEAGRARTDERTADHQWPYWWWQEDEREIKRRQRLLVEQMTTAK